MIAYMEIDSVNGSVIDVVPPTPEKGNTYYFSYDEKQWIKIKVEHKKDFYNLRSKKLFH